MLPASAALASCGHLRLCKLPWMQVQLPWVDLPSPSGSSNPVAFGDKFCQRQNFRALTKPTTARIALIYKKSEAILASGGGFAAPFGIVKSSRPWRQILPQAKFPRQLHLHPAVTYVHVSSLGCKYSFLGLRAFSTLCQSVDFVNILGPRLLRGGGSRLIKNVFKA